MQKHTQALAVLNIFWLGLFIETPLRKKIKYQSWYSTLCCGPEVQKPTQPLQSVKFRANTFDWIPKWARTVLSLIYFSWDILRDPPPQKKIQISKLIFTPYCGFEVQTPTQALQSGKDPDNAFEWNPKWVRTLPSLIYLSCDINRDPPPQKKFQISKRIFDTLLWAWGADTHSNTSVS